MIVASHPADALLRALTHVMQRPRQDMEDVTGVALRCRYADGLIPYARRKQRLK